MTADFNAPTPAMRRLFAALDTLAGVGSDLVDLDRFHPSPEDLGLALQEPASSAFAQIHRSLVEELLAKDGLTARDFVRHFEGVLTMLRLYADHSREVG